LVEGVAAEGVARVGAAGLVVGAGHELQARDVDVDGAQDLGDGVAVVAYTLLDQVDGRFEVVEEAVDVGQQDCYFAAGGEELGDFQHRHEVAAVRLAGRRGSPVDFEGAFIFVEDLFDDLGV
jgi:hypothetical protein